MFPLNHVSFKSFTDALPQRKSFNTLFKEKNNKKTFDQRKFDMTDKQTNAEEPRSQNNNKYLVISTLV